MRRSAPFLQTGTPQLRSGKFLPLRHEAERRIFSVLAAFFPYFEAERRIFSVLRSGAPHFFRITKRKALFTPNSVPERRTYYVCCPALACFPRSKWAAFRSVMAAFRPVSTERSAAYFQDLQAGFTIEYRVFKDS